MKPQKIPIGLVGLGLMGSSIAACILAAGHQVTSLLKSGDTSGPEARQRIASYLSQLHVEGLLKEEPLEALQRLTIAHDVAALSALEVVIETITEDEAEKRSIFMNLESVLSKTAIIGSNTSGIPISALQKGMKHPQRLLGIHWAEPAHITRFMEVICGDQTDSQFAFRIVTLAETWNKEPTLVRKDIRGFITNRIMYAMLREAFYLVENGYASVEDVDRSLRNDLGWWITFAGPFRFMDLTGIPAYRTVMKDLFRELDNSTGVPPLIENLVTSGATGVGNARGFYDYTPESAREWEQSFIAFSYDIRKLAEKYSAKHGARQ